MKTKIFFAAAAYLIIGISLFAQTPTLQTRKATNVNAIIPHSSAGSFTATLNGIVNANGTNCYVFFEYGETENYGFNVSATPGTVSGNTDVTISADITIPNNQLSSVRTKINFRIKVINENDTYCSQNFVATAVNPTRKIDIQPEYSNGSNSLMTLINYNSYDVTVVYKNVNSVTVYAMQTSEIYVPENEVITFEYDYILFRQILPTTRLSTEPKLSRDYIRIKNLGRINSSNVQLYKIYNSSSTQAVNVSVEEVPSATNITIEAKSAVFFVEQAGGYAPTISVDGVQFANVSPDVYYYEEGFYLDIQSLSSTPYSATFEIYNRDDVAHTYVFRNASGTEHTYTLNGYEIQNITLSNEVWDVYITVYDKDEPDSYSFIRTGNTFGYAEYALNGKLKIASATPAEISPLTPYLENLTQNSQTSFSATGVITGNPAQSETLDYHFIYGTDPDNLNQSTTTQQITIPAGQNGNVNTTISGLTTENLYYCRLVAGTTESNSKKIFLSSLPLSNLKMHLRADLNVTSSSSVVSNWGDISGNGNNAEQNISANQPVVVQNSINEKPAIRFNGTSSKLTLPTSATLGIQSNPYEMFIVAKSASSSVQFLVSGNANEQFEYHLNGVGARFIPITSTYLDEGLTGAYTDGNAHIFSARASATGGAVRVDGTDGGTSSANILSSNSGALQLGVRSDGTYYFNGDIAEVILYNTNLSTSDRSTVEHYLANRYGITSGALPVELTSFTASASDGKVLLNWQTATEVNNYGFEVARLRSPNYAEARWETLGFVKGHGNSNSPKSYEFIDTYPPTGKLHYRIKQIDTDGSFEYYGIIAEIEFNITDVQEYAVLPTEYSLSQNYPNPFNPSTAIRYQIPSVDALSSVEVLVTLKIYDTLGREVATLVNEQKAPGNYEVQFNGGNLASGIYLYKLQSGSYSSSKKLMLLK